jgi:hypothetical protein
MVGKDGDREKGMGKGLENVAASSGVGKAGNVNIAGVG